MDSLPTLCLLISYIVLFSIKKRLKALIRRLKVKHIFNTVYNCPRTASKVIDNIISTVNIFKKQYTDNKVS